MCLSEAYSLEMGSAQSAERACAEGRRSHGAGERSAGAAAWPAGGTSADVRLVTEVRFPPELPVCLPAWNVGLHDGGWTSSSGSNWTHTFFYF